MKKKIILGVIGLFIIIISAMNIDIARAETYEEAALDNITRFNGVDFIEIYNMKGYESKKHFEKDLKNIKEIEIDIPVAFVELRKGKKDSLIIKGENFGQFLNIKEEGNSLYLYEESELDEFDLILSTTLGPFSLEGKKVIIEVPESFKGGFKINGKFIRFSSEFVECDKLEIDSKILDMNFNKGDVKNIDIEAKYSDIRLLNLKDSNNIKITSDNLRLGIICERLSGDINVLSDMGIAEVEIKDENRFLNSNIDEVKYNHNGKNVNLITG